MNRFVLGAAAAAITLVGTAAAAQPYGYYRDSYYGDRYYGEGRYRNDRAYRDSDRDGIPDRAEWNRDRDRDGRPDQFDRYDNRRDRYRHHRGHRDDYSWRYDSPRSYDYGYRRW